MANDLILKTSFEGTPGFADWIMTVGSIDFNNRVCSDDFHTDGLTSAKAGPSENVFLIPLVPVTKHAIVTFDLFFPADQNWFSGGTLFRYGNGFYAEILFLADADNVVLYSFGNGDPDDPASANQINCIIPCGVAASMSFEYTDDDQIITSVNGTVVSTIPNTKEYAPSDEIQLTHSGTEFFFGCTYYLDKLEIINNPGDSGGGGGGRPPYLSSPVLQSPDENGYAVSENQTALLEVVLDGGSPRTRLDELGGTRTVTVQWSGRPKRWKEINDFFKQNMSRNYEPFFIFLIIDTAEYAEYIVNLVPNSIKSSTPSGLTWVIEATLEVQPRSDEVSDWPT